MDQDRIEAGPDSNNFAESETSSQEEDSRDIAGREPKNKIKLRSIKLSRVPSFRSSIRQQKPPSSPSPSLISGYSASSELSTPFAMSDASPNYTKATNCSDAKKGRLQKRPSFKSKKSLTRISSKRKLKKTRPMRVASFGSSGSSTTEKSAQRNHRPSIVLPSEAYTSLGHSKVDFQASSRNSECSTVSSDDQHQEDGQVANSTSDSPVRVLKKKSSLRPQRILTKTSSLKSKRSTRKKCTDVPEIMDSSVERATCSSTLKDNKFPRKVEVKTGGVEPGGNSAVRVCPYSYCSLHGHRHGAVPPVKRFVSMRRRFLRNQKSTKPDSGSIPKVKRSTNRRKGNQSSQIVSNGDSENKETIQNNIANPCVTEKVFKPELHGEDNDSGDCAKLAETLLGEATSHPHPSFEQNKTSDSLMDKSQTQLAISAFQETDEECRGVTTEPMKLVSEANDTESKEGRIAAASSTQSRHDEPIFNVDHCKSTETSLPELNSSVQCNSISLKLGGIGSSSNEEVPVDAILHQEAKGDRAAGLNWEVFEGKSNIEGARASTTTRVIGTEMNEHLEPDDSFLDRKSSFGGCTLNSAPEEPNKINKNQKFTGFWGLVYQHMKSSVAAEVETALPLDGKDKEKQVKDNNVQKNESFSCQSLPGTPQNMGVGECDAREQKFEPWQSDAIKLVQEAFDKILSEIPDHSSDDQSISGDITSEPGLSEKNNSAGGERSSSSSFECTEESTKQDPEESEIEAVDNDTKTSEEEKAASEQEKQASQKTSKNWSNLKKVIILNRFVKALEKVRNFNPRKPQFLPMAPDPETEKVNLRHQTVEERKNAEEWMLDYALRKVISTLAPAQKRKVGLLVQAFETVSPPTDIKTRLSFSAESSSHATPVQTCTGSPIQTGEQSYSADLSYCSNAEVDMSASETTQKNLEDEKSVDLNLEKGNNCILTDDQPDLVDIYSTKLEEPRLSDKLSSKPDETRSTSHEEFLGNGKFLPEVSKEVHMICDTQIRGRDIKFTSKKSETGKFIDGGREQARKSKSELSSIVGSIVSTSFSELLEEQMAACGGKDNSNHEVLQECSAEEKFQPRETFDIENFVDSDGEEPCEPKSELSSIVSSVVSSASFTELPVEKMAAEGQANPKHEVVQRSSQEESEHHETNDTELENKLEKQKYMRLWYLLYKHMVSSSAEDGTRPLEGADKEERRGDTDKLLGTEDADSCKDSSEKNQNMLMDYQIASSQKIECHHIEAIKRIEDAIDEIHLPEIQDDSTDDQSNTGDKIPEQDFEKNHSESREIFLSNSADSAEDSFPESNNKKVEQCTTLDTKEKWLPSNNINALDESEAESKLGNKPKPKTQKSWSNVKKLILLKRFLKAVEKVRTFNPKEPQYLPLNSDSEAEKVNLRHQNMGDRKNAEDWMLDHALQQVVAKLTPARKRKVELLVEAFETVTPSLEFKTHQQHSTAASPHARLIRV